MKKTDERSTRVKGHYATGQPSVTTILSVLNKPALNAWKEKNIFEASREGAVTMKEARKKSTEISQKACDIGLRVHDYVEKYDTENQPETHSDLTDYYRAFHDWVIRYKPEFIAREITVTSKEFVYKGTLDILAKVNGKGCLIDLKTGKYIYDSTQLQVSAYKQAYEEQGRGKIDELWCLLLEKGRDGLPTGKYKFEQLEYNPETFNALVKVYWWKMRMNEK